MLHKSLLNCVIDIGRFSECVCARFEAIVPGNPELVAEYQNKLYYLDTDEKLEKFMRYVCITAD